MITITRRRARSLRAVFRRNALGLPARVAMPPIVLRADDGRLRAHYHHGRLAVEHVGAYPPGETAMLVLPPEALAGCAGSDDSPVTLESSGSGRVTASWADRGVPQARDYALTVKAPDDGALRSPTTWAEAPAELLDALAEAAQTAGVSGRYALDCIRIGGDPGRIVATDGRQLLVRSGFSLPWGGELLIDAAPIFGCPALPRDRPLRLGDTGTHIVLNAGDWTIWCAIRTDVRYPDVDHIIPTASERATVLRLDRADAAYLTTALSRLPGAGEEHSPITVECNGCVAVRARDAATTRIAEIVLDRSSYAGPPVQVSMNRRFLARAVGLGCPEIAIAGPDQPLVGRADHQTYVWQPLDPEDAIGHPEGDAIRLDASGSKRPAERSIDRPHSDPETHPSTPRNLMRESIPQPARASIVATPQAARVEPVQPAANLATLIAEAERLHATLGEAKVGLARLIAGLRRHRKQSKLVAETLRSLRQLKLAEAAE